MAAGVNGDQFRRLAVKLNAAADTGLKTGLRAGLKSATVPVIGDLKAAAASKLPKRGGLNSWVAGGVFKTSIRLSARTTDVRIIHHDRDSGGGGDRRFFTDQGGVRHPVFGNRGAWVTQQIPGASGWFTDTAKKSAAEIAPFVKAVLDAIALEVTRL